MTLRISLPLFGVTAGALAGAVDAIVLPMSLRTRGTPLLPAHACIAAVWTSVTLLAMIGVLFSAPRLHRAGITLMLFAGPGLVMLSRAAEPVKDVTGWSSPVILALWALLLIALAIPLWRVRLERTRGLRWWLIGTSINAALLLYCACDIPAADVFAARGRIESSHGHRNVLLILLDTTRYDNAIGDDSPAMPALAAFARSSVSFRDAWAPSPWTIPSHFAILTGEDPWRVPFDTTARRFREKKPMLAERFRRLGYSTAAIMANLTLSPEAGFADGYGEFTVSRGSGVCRSAAGDLLNRLWLHGLPPSPVCGSLMARDVTSRALHFMARARRPYFLTLNYMDAHSPYYVPSDCASADHHGLRNSDLIAFAGGTSKPEILRRVHEQYRLAMRCMDRSLAELLDAVAHDPDGASTTMIVAGDHGEQFGEFGKTGHGNSVFPAVLRVPLILHIPDQAATRVDGAVSTTDIHPTLLRLLEPDRAVERTLLDPLQRRPVVSFFAAHGESAFSVAGDGLELIRDQTGRETLLSERGTRLDAGAQPVFVARGRRILAGAMAAQRGSGEFRALGYMN